MTAQHARVEIRVQLDPPLTDANGNQVANIDDRMQVTVDRAVLGQVVGVATGHLIGGIVDKLQELP